MEQLKKKDHKYQLCDGSNITYESAYLSGALKKCEKRFAKKTWPFMRGKGLEKMISTFSSRFGIFHTPLSYFLG